MTRKKPRHTLLFVVVFAVYALFIGANHGAMTWSYIALTASIVDHHSLNIDHFAQFTVDVAYYEGHFYSGVPPGLSFLSIPTYALLRYGFDLPLNEDSQSLICFFCALISSSLAGVLSVVLLLKIGERFSSNIYQNRLIALAFAFGTSMFVYSSIMLSRVVCVFLLLSAHLLVLRIKENRNSPKSAFFVGMLCATSVLFDYITFMFIPVFLIYTYFVFKRAGTCIWFLIGGLIPLLLLAGYHYAVFGSAIDTPYAHRAYLTQKGYHADGIAGLQYPRVSSLLSILLSYGNSLFAYMPILLLGIYSAVENLRNKLLFKEKLFVLSLFICYCLIISSYKAFDLSGFGQRFFLPLIPFLILPLFFVDFHSRGRFFKTAFFAFFVISVGNNIFGAAKPACFRYHTRWDNLLIYYEKFFDNRPRLTFLSQLIEENYSNIMSINNYIYIINYIIPLVFFIAINLAMIYYYIKIEYFGKNQRNAGPIRGRVHIID